MIYLGDGVGDNCSSLNTKEEDFVMPRKNNPVWDLISKNPRLIHGWTDGADFEKRSCSALFTQFLLREIHVFIFTFETVRRQIF